MLKKCLLWVAAFATLLSAQTEPRVSFSAPSKVGSVFVPPGLYKLKVQGNLVLLTEMSTKKCYNALVRVEKLSKPSTVTAAQARVVDGIQRIEVIVVQGEDYKLLF